MRQSVFFDTNVWVDYFEPARNGHRISNQLVGFCLSNDVLILSSACSINDLHYILQADNKKTLKASGFVSETAGAAAQAAALECIDSVTNITTVLASGHNEVRMGCVMCKQHHDFEDNVLVATAMRAQSPLIVTNDKALLKHSMVTAMTPADALEHLKMLAAA